MNKLLKSALLSVALGSAVPHTALAKGASAPSTGQPNQGDALIDLGLNLAITYAKMDPRYSSILSTLGINNANDLKAYLNGNSSGANLQGILARLAFLQASKDPKVKAAFEKLGIKNEQDLKKFLSGSEGGANFEMILNVALQQAKANPKYAVWLNRLNINSVQDLKNLLNGSQSGNLQSLILVVALNYVESKPKYAKYVPIIQAVMASMGLNPGDNGTGDDDTSDDDIIDLGAYSGMTVGEVKAARKIK